MAVSLAIGVVRQWLVWKVTGIVLKDAVTIIASKTLSLVTEEQESQNVLMDVSQDGGARTTKEEMIAH